jgi:hypothetical protein
MKKTLLLLIGGISVLLFSFACPNQKEGVEEYQNSYFKEYAEYYCCPPDKKPKYLGDVVVTIAQEKDGFRLYAINDQVVKMDNVSDWYLNNQRGQVRINNHNNDYMYYAHWRKNGISYMVFFNSTRIRDYYVSH